MKGVGRREGWTPRGSGGMWDITLDDMKQSWALELDDLVSDGTESRVVLAMANSLLRDAPNLLRRGDVKVPSPKGDDDRALRCLVWLSHSVIPIWVPWWVRKTTPHKDGEILQLIRELEGIEPWEDSEDSTIRLAELALALRGLLFSFPGDNKIHRRSMHKAQQMGVRAAYRGVLCHSEGVLRSMALMAVSIIVRACPDQESWKDTILLTESTQGSALLLLDQLLLERGNARTENT